MTVERVDCPKTNDVGEPRTTSGGLPLGAAGGFLRSTFCDSHLLLGVALAAGVFVRYPWNTESSFWCDEIMRVALLREHPSFLSAVAASSQGRAFIQLGEWLYGRPMLLWAGGSETALRFWPLVFSLLAIVFAYRFVARATGSPLCAFWVALTLALAPSFVLRGREFKPYAWDLAWTMFMLDWTTSLFPVSGGRKPALAMSLLYGFVLSLFAMLCTIAPFVIGGVAIYLLLCTGSVIYVMAMVLPAAAVYLATAAAIYLPQTGFVNDFWLQYFPTSMPAIRNIAEKYVETISQFTFFPWPLAFCAYFLILPWLALRRRDRTAILLAVPFPVHVVMSLLRKYPLLERPSTYLYGIMLLGMVYACWRTLGARASKPQRVAAGALMGAACVFSYAAGIHSPNTVGDLLGQMSQMRYYPGDQARNAFAVLGAEFREGDVLVCGTVSRSLAVHYAMKQAHNPHLIYAARKTSYTIDDRTPESAADFFDTEEFKALSGRRIWFYCGHVHPGTEHVFHAARRHGEVEVKVWRVKVNRLFPLDHHGLLLLLPGTPASGG